MGIWEFLKVGLGPWANCPRCPTVSAALLSPETSHELRLLLSATSITHAVVRALHRHRKGVVSIPAGRPKVDEFFSTVPGLNIYMCMISTGD